MGVAIFFVLALIAAAVIVYPLLPGRRPEQPAPAVTDGDIDRAVRRLRRERGRSGLSCPSCGMSYQAGDRFCVRCGNGLPQAPSTDAGVLCPGCGATVRQDDRFCAKCGQDLVVGEKI